MTVHAIRAVCAPTDRPDPPRRPKPEPPELPDVVPEQVRRNVLDKFGEVLPEQNTPEIHVPADVAVGLPEHVRSGHRFNAAEDKAAILDAVENDVVADAEWYRIEYHECYHDEDPPRPCGGWIVEREYGPIPEGV